MPKRSPELMTRKLDVKIYWFAGSVLLLSWTIVFFIRVFGLSQSPMAAVMIFPMLLAALFMAVSREDEFSDIGWKLPGWKYGLIGVFLPLVQIGLTLGAGAGFNLIFYNGEHLLAHKPTPHVWLNLALCLPGMFIPYLVLSLPNLIVGWLNHLGEEFAWRGYLFRKISKSHSNYLKGILISGSVWWAWHFPMFWLSPVLVQLSPGQMALTIILSFFALLGTAGIYSWIYIRSGSIWAPTIMHLSWNLFRSVLTGRLADGAPGLFKGDLWLINGEGIIGNVISALAGGFFIFLVVHLDRKGSRWKWEKHE